ncbi:hypothetical protein AMBR_CKHPCMOK_00707 [Lacticaseibacillus rhamnosus]|uniref:Uncharacterized protein n=1 Tax=Lacticaseibacillus rhamnosus TaxID=47715 RepID=A0A6N2YJA9_LACRH|nr:hypothetical protein AMBR_EADFOONE_00013 [Lacticaseibacillus rhamnosus]VTU71557.1 hypothetical protein AMBR_CKHPCMOK_00707 [Lacticaseibacillus rhamnosus]
MALVVMARAWPLRPRSLHADFCAGERVMGVKADLRPRSLQAGPCAGERVMGVKTDLRQGPYMQVSGQVNTL